MFDFIEKLIDFTSDAESPTEFWRWAAISCISTILRDNIFLETHIGTIYPNMFIILYSDSGIARKAAPCRFVGKLIQAVGNTKFIAGRASMQAVVRELGRGYTNEQGYVISGASGLLYSEELSSFVVEDPAAIPLLTDLYDYHERWANNLVTAQTALKNVCLGMLAASNSDLFNSVYTDKAVKGGLLGRTLIIKKEGPRHRKSLIDLKSQNEATFEELKKHLIKISKIHGHVKLSKDASDEYNSWYYSIPDEVFIDRIGFGSRLGTHVIKISIALAASRETFNGYIEKDDIIYAIEICQELRKTYRELSFGIGAATSSYQASIVMKALISEEHYHITRKRLIQRTFGDLNSVEDLDRILIMMVQGGLIDEVAKDNEVGYKISLKGLDILMRGRNGQ